MDINKEKQRSKDIIARAERVGTDERDIAELRSEFGRFGQDISAWMNDRLGEAKADGRETLHADDARKQLQLTACHGEAAIAVGDAISRHAQAKANRDRLSGNGGHAGEPVPKSIEVPSLREYRELKAQSIGSDPGGGYVVFTEIGPFFDRLRPAAVVLQAGPVVVDMESDKIDLPGLGSSTTVALVGEASTLSESDAALVKVMLTARKYSVRTVASSEWLADANVPARRIIADDHTRQLGAKLDLEMLEGNSGGHIIGLRRIAGVTATELGAGNGATPSLDDVRSLIYRLENANVDKSRLALFMAHRTYNTFAQLKDGSLRYQLQPDPSQESRRQLFGVPVFCSSQINIAETVGGSTDCSYIIGADMSKVVVGRRLAAAVLYDPYSKSSTDQVVIQTLSRWDMNVLQTAAVQVLTGVRP